MNSDIIFENIEELVDYVINEVENNEDKFITVIAKFDKAREIFKNVMMYEDINFELLHIESPEMDNYCGEFLLSFWMNDGFIEFGCEKMKNEHGSYIHPHGDITFLFGDCSSKIIPLCDDSTLYFVNIDDACDCGEWCCGNCDCGCHDTKNGVELSEINDGGLHGFSASKTNDDGFYNYSFYTSENLSKDDIRSMLKEFGF